MTNYNYLDVSIPHRDKILVATILTIVGIFLVIPMFTEYVWSQDHAKAQKQFNETYERLQVEAEACQAKCAGKVQCVTDCVDMFIKARDQAGKQMRQQQGR